MLSLSTDAGGVVRFETTRAASVLTLGAQKSAPLKDGDSWRCEYRNYFLLDGFAEKFYLGSIVKKFNAYDAESWEGSHEPDSQSGPLDRAWALLLKAFDADLLVTASGCVRNDEVLPSEAELLAALARSSALGEALVIPPATSVRMLFVTDIVISRPPRVNGGGGGGGAAGGGDPNPI
jgi:hypothetical protein